MKTDLYYVYAFMLTLLCLGCQDDDSLNIAEVSAVETLYAPQDDAFFNLGAQSAVTFEWQAAKSSDNGVVLYDVSFDVESGDFSEPIFVMPSDGKGFQNTLTLPFAQLNKIAGMAGIQPEGSGRLKWMVSSSKGLNVTTSNASGVFEVERPGGFSTPDELFITGSATEGGEDLAKALSFKKTGPTSFEIYTSLKPGSYQLASRNKGTPDLFFVDNAKLKADGETTVTDSQKVYRLRIDFSDGGVNMATIDKIELWFPPKGEYLFDFAYAGNGTWEALDKLIEFKQESWGRDERYKFKFTVTKNGASAEEWFGSVNGDNQKPDANTAESFWYMVPVSDDYWNNSFKFATSVDNAKSDVRIIFNSQFSEYTHVITPK